MCKDTTVSHSATYSWLVMGKAVLFSELNQWNKVIKRISSKDLFNESFTEMKCGRTFSLAEPRMIVLPCYVQNVHFPDT